MNVKTIQLIEDWAHRNLLIVTKSGVDLSPAVSLLKQHLQAAAS